MRSWPGCGGKQLSDVGYYQPPIVVSDLRVGARLMQVEPFGPVTAISPFATPPEAIERANNLPYGLGTYAFTTSLRTAIRSTLAWKPA